MIAPSAQDPTSGGWLAVRPGRPRASATPRPIRTRASPGSRRPSTSISPILRSTFQEQKWSLQVKHIYLSILSTDPFSWQMLRSIICNIVKLREREGQGVDPGRSLKGHLWMVDGGWWISFPWCFTLNLVVSPSHHHHQTSLNLQD